MQFRDLPIKRKVVSVIMLTTVSALLLTAAAFMIYDAVTYRQTIVRHLRTSAEIIAHTATGALSFHNKEEAQQALDSLSNDPNVTAAALYDAQGKLFVWYPPNRPQQSFPSKPGPTGNRPDGGYHIIFLPAFEGDKQAGTVFLKFDLRGAYESLRLHGGIAAFVIASSVLLAFIISNYLQRLISKPVLDLANSARVVSEKGDYSIRAKKTSNDELGVLTDSFNAMLARVEEQTENLRENKERLRLALESSRAASWTWNLRTNQVIWDELMPGLFGLKSGEFQGTSDHFLKLVHPGDREKVVSGMASAIERKEQANFEFRIIWPDGSSHYLVSRGQAIYSENGEPLRMTGLSIDVTERRQAEEARSFLAAIVDSSDDAIIGKDLESKVVSWNAGAERMFGYSEAEMVGKPITVLLSHDRPDEEAKIMAEVKRGAIRHLQTLRVRQDGKAIEVSLTVSPIRNARRDIIGVSSIARDITEQQRARAALERHATVLREQAQMLDLANVLARDLDDRIILWNTGMEKMYGWSKAEAVGRLSHELFRTILPQPLEKIRAALFEKGRWEGELRHFRKDGRQLVVASQWVVHIDDRGKPAAILEVNNDVTARKEAEDQVRRMNVELEERVEERTAELRAANHEMEAFTYSVAHDLRAPLRHIDAFSRILHEDFGSELPEEAQRYLANIRQGSRNMSQLVDDLLNLARVGRQELKRLPTSLNAIINDVKDDLDRETRGRQIKWHIEHLPMIECDAGLIKQVFTNLLSNAVKYTRPRAAAQIEIGLRKINGETAVFVRDNGVGFSMKYADKLFGVFQRLHRQEEFEGTGVGLATVERIVRKHGGRVWAEAELDKGATFYFTTAALQEANGALEPSLTEHRTPADSAR
jgi:PAS domain S-box-containing protein